MTLEEVQEHFRPDVPSGMENWTEGDHAKWDFWVSRYMWDLGLRKYCEKCEKCADGLPGYVQSYGSTVLEKTGDIKNLQYCSKCSMKWLATKATDMVPR